MRALAGRARRPGTGRTGAAVLALGAPLLLGCAESVRPVLGGLKIGMRGGAFRTPVLESESLPFTYPRDAWERGIGGETTLRIHITRRGRVDSAYVVRSSGHRSLDSAAVAGALELRYRPARQGEERVDVWAILPVRYPLPERAGEP